MKWLRVSTSDGSDQVILISDVMSVRNKGTRVTFVMRNGTQYDWSWDGKSATWAKLVAAMDLTNAL